MRTLFDFDLEADHRITIDRRAKQRGKTIPSHTDVYWIDTYGHALNHANNYQPVAIIKGDGSCLLFSCGGTGLVWVCTPDGNVSESQQNMLDTILTHLSWLGAVVQTSDTLRYFDL